MQAWHNAKVALITATLYVPTAVAMIAVGWSSRRFEERRWHSCVPLAIATIAFMCGPFSNPAAHQSSARERLCQAVLPQYASDADDIGTHIQTALESAAMLCRFVPAGMKRGAISGFVLLIVAAMGTWAVYGGFQCSTPAFYNSSTQGSPMICRRPPLSEGMRGAWKSGAMDSTSCS